MNNTKKQISDLGKRMDKIYADKNMTSQEKQEALQPLAKRISDLAFDANVWYGEFKKEVAEVVANLLTDIQIKYYKYNNEDFLQNILVQGAKKAKVIAAETLAKATKALGL